MRCLADCRSDHESLFATAPSLATKTALSERCYCGEEGAAMKRVCRGHSGRPQRDCQAPDKATKSQNTGTRKKATMNSPSARRVRTKRVVIKGFIGAFAWLNIAGLACRHTKGKARLLSRTNPHCLNSRCACPGRLWIAWSNFLARNGQP